MLSAYNATSVEKNHSILAYDKDLKCFGTDGVLYAIGNNGDIYRAIETKANMVGADITDTTKWLKVDLINNQSVFNLALGVVKKGFSLILGADLKISVGQGDLYIYNNTLLAYKKVSIAEQLNTSLDIIDTSGTVIEAGKAELDVTQYDDNGTPTALSRNTYATFSKLYIDEAGKVYQMRGTVEYRSLNSASYQSISEEIPNLQHLGLYYIGGLLTKKGTTKLNTLSQARVIYASKLGESQVGGAGGNLSLLKAPLVDIAELQDVESPENGEARQLTDYLPSIVFYVFNSDATQGEAPNDGTVGFWNKLESSGKLEEEIKTADFTTEIEKQYLVDSSANAITVTIPDVTDDTKFKSLSIQKKDNSNNHITVVYGSDTLYILTDQYQSVDIIYTSAGARVISDYLPHNINIDYSAVGRIVFQLPNADKGIYALDGGTITDRLLAQHIANNSSKYSGFTVNGDNVTLPDWRGEILYGGGGRGISTKIGDSVNQSIQSHRHNIRASYSTSGGGYAYESGNANDTSFNTQSSGGTYTRVYGKVATLCIIGTSYFKLDANTTLAKPITVTFNGLTVNGGKSNLTIYEGVHAFTAYVDLGANKKLTGATNATIADERTGLILFNRYVGGGDFTIDLTEGDKPIRYIREVDDSSYTGINNQWRVVKTWSVFNKNVGDVLELNYLMPTRHDSSSWGGLHLRIQYTVDNGTTWKDCYDSGYSGAMASGGTNIIDQISGNIIIDIDEVTNASSVQFRYQAKSYNDSNGKINADHSIVNTGALKGGFMHCELKVIN